MVLRRGGFVFLDAEPVRVYDLTTTPTEGHHLKYPALTYAVIYGLAVLAFVITPTPLTLLFVVPALAICEFILLPAMRRDEAKHRAN